MRAVGLFVVRPLMDHKPRFDLQPEALYLWVAHSVLSEAAMTEAISELGAVGEAYACALQVVASAAKRAEGKYSDSTTKSKSRDAILAGYIAGLILVERAILGGFNAQAAALVRQEFEAVAALAEIEGGMRQDGRTPQIRHVPSVPSRFYGELSNIAHFSNTLALQSITSKPIESSDAPGPATHWLLSPQHLSGSSARLFATHTLLLLNLAEHQARHNLECHNLESSSEEVLHFNKAIDLLREAGAIEDVE